MSEVQAENPYAGLTPEQLQSLVAQLKREAKLERTKVSLCREVAFKTYRLPALINAPQNVCPHIPMCHEMMLSVCRRMTITSTYLLTKETCLSFVNLKVTIDNGILPSQKVRALLAARCCFEVT